MQESSGLISTSTLCCFMTSWLISFLCFFLSPIKSSSFSTPVPLSHCHLTSTALNVCPSFAVREHRPTQASPGQVHLLLRSVMSPHCLLFDCRQSGDRVPHYLRSVKTPDSNEQAMLNSHVNWSSRPISRSNTAKPSIEGMFSNPRDRLLGVYATQDGNKDHMAVVAAAMQQGKVGKLESRQASTRATIRGILSGIK